MRWIDEAAHVLATQWTGTAYNIAVYIGGVRVLPTAADRSAGGGLRPG